MPRRGNFAALGAAIIGLLAIAGSAQAADTSGQFVCRSSAARVVTFGSPPLATVEPVRANVNGTPCASDQNAETVKPTTIGPITADAVRAYTTYTPGVGNAAVSSDAIITAPRIVLGGLSIGVDAIEAHASATCTSATTPPTLASSSKVVNLTINGSTLAIPTNSQQFTLNLSPLVKLVLNEKVTSTAGVVTQRAVHIITLGNDIVVGEAIAGTASGNPCAGVGPSGPPGASPCPSGSTYDPSANVCEIVTSSGKVIVVGIPFQGPSGGKVITLAEAQKLYPHNPCVHGPGPQFVIVGTNHNDRITGTNKADRIILLGGNDRADGGRGNDCVDGGTGNDSISAGFGADHVSGGSGNDHINANQAGPKKHVNCGTGSKDKARIFASEQKFTSHNCERIFITKATPRKK